MAIFDRWGKQVFFTKQGAESWDGKDMRTGELVPQGMYVYKITIIDNAGKVHHRVDHVTVIR
jgi:gliding motility-associated-like protein